MSLQIPAFSYLNLEYDRGKKNLLGQFLQPLFDKHRLWRVFITVGFHSEEVAAFHFSLIQVVTHSVSFIHTK